jgi:hypothetical protein
MRDLDSAVGRLDNILMSVYVVVAIMIIAVSLVGHISKQRLNVYALCIIGDSIVVACNRCRSPDHWYFFFLYRSYLPDI